MGSTWKEELHILCLFTLFKEGRSGGNHFSMILKKKAMRSEGDALSVALGEFGKGTIKNLRRSSRLSPGTILAPVLQLGKASIGWSVLPDRSCGYQNL